VFPWLRPDCCATAIGTHGIFQEVDRERSGSELYRSAASRNAPRSLSNLAALELSSFKCGHDAPIYSLVDQPCGWCFLVVSLATLLHSQARPSPAAGNRPIFRIAARWLQLRQASARAQRSLHMRRALRLRGRRGVSGRAPATKPGCTTLSPVAPNGRQIAVSYLAP
jgi:hypothetical protein